MEGNKNAENISYLYELSFSNLSSLNFYFSGEDKVVLEKVKISKDNIILFESRRLNNVQIIIWCGAISIMTIKESIKFSKLQEENKKIKKELAEKDKEINSFKQQIDMEHNFNQNLGSEIEELKQQQLYKKILRK